MSQYSCFARYYDQLMADVDYKARAQYFHKIIQKYTPDAKILLDLGCGTGSLSCEFAKMGYDVIGVDCSEEMLSEAMGKPMKDILYLCQDMRELDLYGTIDVTVCAMDSLNHLDSEEDLLEAFKKVSLFSNPGALFLFDMNTPYKHREILADNCYVYEMDRLFCVWQNQYDEEEDCVEIALDFFEEEDGLYRRSSEYFCERAYNISTIKALLQKVGMKLLHVYEADSFEDPKQDTQRYIFVAQKA